ncbi:MAG: aspartate aminotransferase family protein [Deltaproteobacteria bacterium]|nr:aspartate aminotransferase family protein [Deltaproteobacteria bacterium]
MKNSAMEKTRKFLTPALVFHTGISVKKARGIYVEGADGRKYMDFASGLATLSLGHCHPAVVRAASAQLRKFIHSGCIFHYGAVGDLAERLADKTPAGMDMFFFSNSGAEAIEGAIKLARFSTGRQWVLAFTGGFHGRTTGALSLTTSAARYRKNYHPLLPSVLYAPYPYCFRCPFSNNPATCSMECFGYLEWMLEHIATPDEVACAVIEPVLGEGGYVVPPPEYLRKLRKLCDRFHILLVMDEVQTGFGRTGRWFASEHSGVRPDIMVMAKAMASGLPLGAIASTRKIMKGWPPGAHGTTFGGNPVACAAASAVIGVIEKQGLVENSRKVGEYAMARLKSLKEKHPCIGDVRGAGLMIGVEFVKKDGRTPDAVVLKRLMKECEKRGLIIVECGRHKNVARFMPPLIIKEKEMEKALSIFEDSLDGADV